MTTPTVFVETVTVAARALEVPDAAFDDGMNLGASNAPGIGINFGGGAIVGEPQQFTLLDQDGDARNPQVSQVIGGDGLTEVGDWPSSGGVEGKGTLPVTAQTPDASGDGSAAIDGTAALTDLAVGWVAGI